MLKEQSVSIKYDDKRKTGKKLRKIKFQGELREEQNKAVTQLTKYNTGVLHAPTAFGKTITAIGVIAKRKVNTVILVHTRQLVDQWQERLMSFLADVDIGIIKGGKHKLSGQIDIATYQSLFNRKDNTVNSLVFNYGQIIIDECHHISAPNYEMILNEIHAKYVLGITATIQRQDGHQPIIFMNAGPVRYVVESDSKSGFEQQVIISDLYDDPPENLVNVERSPNISHVYAWLMENELRNRQIVEDVISELKNNRQPLILTERREHALIISKLITEKNISNLVLRGGMKSQELKKAKESLNSTQVLIATGKYIGEGFDLAKLDTLFLALPISWKASLAQYVGRIHRQHAGKERVIVYDYVDQSLPMLQRMFNKRVKGYDALGYTLTYKGEQQMFQVKLKL